MSSNIIRLSIDIPRSLHKALKFYTLNHDTTIKDFVLDLIEKNIPEEIEDYILGKMAMEAKKQGSLGKKNSQKFLNNLKLKITKTKKNARSNSL